MPQGLLFDLLSSSVFHALKDSFPHTSYIPEITQSSFSPSPNISLGHFAFSCFYLAKHLKQNPAQIASMIANNINKEDFASVQANGPYVNLRVKNADYYHKLISPICNQSFFCHNSDHQYPKTMFEYSQPNTHKTLHVGHMRNLCLGNALVRMYRFLGRDVLAVTYPGDVGTHVAKCLWYMKYHNEEAPPEQDKGNWLGKLYAKGHEKLENEKGGPKEEQGRRELSAILKQLHNREGEFFDLWKKTRQWSLSTMKEAYDWADVSFDHWFFESEMDAPSLSLMKELLDQGLLKRDQGAVGANLEDEGLGFCLLIKSDGTGLYATKDVFLAKKKFDEFNIQKNIVIVDNRQTLHFKQVFKILGKIGFKQEKDCFHLPYDVVELPKGAMSSRKGTIVPLMQLINSIEDRIRNDFLNQYRHSWPIEEIEETAKTIANGTIKYGMLRIDNNRKIVFDLNEWIKLDGNTGPYLQYVCTRINSLLQKLSFDQQSIPDFSVLSEKYEIPILIKLSLFNKILFKAAEECRPSLMCTYLFELGRLFNTFYASCPINNAKTRELKTSRLHLSWAVKITMQKGLSVLGIETPKRM